MQEEKDLEETVVSDPKQFNEYFEKFSTHSTDPKDEYWISYFVGGPDQSGQSWCPDCSKAKPAIMASLRKGHKKQPLRLLKCVVPTKFEWVKNPYHDYRVHPSLMIGGLPSVLLFKRERMIAKLTEDQLFIGGLLDKLTSMDF